MKSVFPPIVQATAQWGPLSRVIKAVFPDQIGKLPPLSTWSRQKLGSVSETEGERGQLASFLLLFGFSSRSQSSTEGTVGTTVLSNLCCGSIAPETLT